MNTFAGKVAVITGSGRGIGRATAELLSAAGARVVINDLDADVAEQTASELPGETAVSVGNLADDGAAERLIATAITRGAGSTSSSTTPATRSTHRSTR